MWPPAQPHHRQLLKATAILFAKVGVSPPQHLSATLKHIPVRVVQTSFSLHAERMPCKTWQSNVLLRTGKQASSKAEISSPLLLMFRTKIRSPRFWKKSQLSSVTSTFSVSDAMVTSIHPSIHLNTSLIVNNAGYVVGVDRVGDLSLENMENMFTTNVFGLIALTQLFVKGVFSA